MKTILLILLSTSFAFSQDTVTFKLYEPEMLPQTSKYKPGFVFYYHEEYKVTLLKWVVVHSSKETIEFYKEVRPGGIEGIPAGWLLDHYRWSALFERDGRMEKGYMDDIDIDIALGKKILWKGGYYEPIESK